MSPLTMLIPFSGGKYLDLGWVAIPVLYLAVIGTVNGVNFTDGVDGLASSVTIMVATFLLRCGDRNECRHCADHLCGCRCAAWIFAV